jgi:DNA invertase Pin-like site-specific DNA recombinase
MNANFAREPNCSYAWTYGRQSHKEQIEENEGLPHQAKRTKAYFTANLEPNGVKWGGFVPDESAVSARTTPFMLRHAGRLLFDLLQPGDHFVVDKIDRLWRSIDDLVDVMKQFRARGIKLHICNMMGCSVTLGTPMGDFMLNIMVCIAQLESDQVSDRTRARFADKRREGKFPGCSSAPLGTKVIGKKDKKAGTDTRQLVWDPEQRKFMGEIVRLADEEGKTATEIGKLMNTHFRKFMGDEFWKRVIVKADPKRNELKGRTWGCITVSKLYWREKQYQAMPPFNPAAIKFTVFQPNHRAGKGFFRDIGRNEPKDTPNPYPFLDGKPIPATAEELYRMAG